MIIQIWEKNQGLAEQSEETLQPEDFAVMFVDANISQD